MTLVGAGAPGSRIADVIDTWYRPTGRARVGIALFGDALIHDDATVDRALASAGHTPLRRKCRLQPRSGEPRVRAGDAVEFAERYGHEYALAIVKSWPELTDREPELVAALRNAGCAVVWVQSDEASAASITEWGADAAVDEQ